jgi:hypothetical protein
LRLWLRNYERGVLLIPLVSWVAPANVSEGGLLFPSLAYCWKRWGWRPDYVVADMGYLGAQTKARCRQNWQIKVLTHVRQNMKMVPPFESETRAICPQGQPLQWLGYDWRNDQHEFAPVEPAQWCPLCWEQSQCPKLFSHHPGEHESLLGLLPLCTRPAQHLLRKIRPWIEPTQSYEKNQLGLSQFFLNSLRLTWTACQMADAASLLRARALLENPPTENPLKEMLPQQMNLDLP